jgi:Protein of unknown function (DUF4238)
MSDSSQTRWPLPGDPDLTLGSAHHLVPQMYQRFFGNERRQIDAVDRDTGRRFRSRIADSVAEGDFYTAINKSGNPDGKSEHLLSWIEGEAFPTLQRLVKCPTFAKFPPSPSERVAVCLFLAFQMTRGRSIRRMTEMLGDIWAHMQVPSKMDNAQAEAWLHSEGQDVTPEAIDQAVSASAIIDQLEFVPDPNSHLVTMGPLALRIFPYLIMRSWYVAEYTSPVLITSDEPVVLFSSDQRRYGRRAGIEYAEEIWFPLGPKSLLVLTKEPYYGPERRALAAEGSASEVMRRIATNAYELILMHPDHDDIDVSDLPEPGTTATL